MEPNQLSFFATCPKGMAGVLAVELSALGAVSVKETVAGVHFGGPLAMAYRACLWSRTANHVLAPIASVPVTHPDHLYQAVHDIAWGDHLSVQSTFVVEFTGHGAGIEHSQFGAQRVKDAIVDWFRRRHGERPSVDKTDPDLRIHAHIEKNIVTISIGLSGRSLHERGYRTHSVAAPMKENLAAAILLRLRWPQIAANTGALIDPMCGSATFLIEGAWMAGDVAPGLRRPRYGFEGWARHDASVWKPLIDEARERAERGLPRIPPIRGFDRDRRAIEAARSNIAAAGLSAQVQVIQAEFDADEAPVAGPGLVVINPPYGERLGKEAEVADLYRRIGHVLKTRYRGWQAGVFTAVPEFGKRMGLRARRTYSFFNGALPCKLLCFDGSEDSFVVPRGGTESGTMPSPAAISAGATMFANRLRKNLAAIDRWASREGVSCFRVYDADMPEYAFAIDLYTAEAGRRVHVQEYAPPASVSVDGAAGRRLDALLVIPEVLAVPPETVFLKTRQRQKGGSQYQRLGQRRELMMVCEGPARLLVNLCDYLDTGLFLDHRLTRALLGQWGAGKRFLNLFCYTAAATVHVALAGALETTSIDMSSTYLDWAQRNFELNGIDPRRNRLVHADCLRWLAQAGGDSNRYDLIFLDPPTFSRSKRMSGTLDIQRDYVELIEQAAVLLSRNGVLVFSTNLRTFRMDESRLHRWKVSDITNQTIPRDFERNPRIHQCFRIERGDFRSQRT